MRSFIFFAICLAYAFGQCPDDSWTLLLDGKRCIKAFSTPKAFPDAQIYCRSLHGYLGSIVDGFDTWLYYGAAELANVSSSHYWIGLYKQPGTTKYAWDNGAALQYTNWKTGTSSAAIDCVLFESISAKWISGNQCTNKNPFICEIVPTGACVYEDFEVNKYNGQSIETLGAGSSRTVSAFNCTKTISVPPNEFAYIFVKARVYAGVNAYLRFIDVENSIEVKRFANNDQWLSVEFSANAATLRVEGFADRNGKLGYQLNFVYQDWKCPYETLRTTTAELRPHIQSPLYNSQLASYYCAKEIVAPPGENVFISLDVYAFDDAYFQIKDPKRNEILARYQNRGEWASTNFHTSAETVLVEAISNRHGRLAFAYDFESVPTTCQTKAFAVTNVQQTIQTYDYSKPLSNYTCTRELRRAADSTGSTTYVYVRTYVAGDGLLMLTDLDTKQTIKEFSSSSTKRTNLYYSAYLTARNVQVYAHAGNQGSVAYMIDYYLR